MFLPITQLHFCIYQHTHNPKILYSLWRRANARNVSSETFLQWPNYGKNSFDKTKLPCYTLPPTQHYSFFRNSLPLFIWLTDWETDHPTDWRTDWRTDRLIYSLTDWFTVWLREGLTDRLKDWLTDWRTDWPTEGLTDRLKDWVNDWLSEILTD